MDTKRSYLVVLMLLIVCRQVALSQNKPPVQVNGAAQQEELDPQLKVNRNGLLERGDIVAAGIMLFDSDPKARVILLDALRQSENSPARMAVCRALIKARTDNKPVKDVQDFIVPLLGALDTQVSEEARLAAEATLIFEYEEIREPLEKFVTDSSTPVRARVNAVNALKLRLDKRAAIKLIQLLDDPDVVSEAQLALDSLGIVPGDSKEARDQTISQIENQAPEVFLGNRITRLEAVKRDMMLEMDSWQKFCLTLLANTYKMLPDDAAKGKFLAEHLGSPRALVKLWALEEAFQWWKGTNPNFPREQFEPILIGLISDPHKGVRLRTAEVLASMVELNSARPLLTQLELEQDDQVKTKIFVALGWACSSAVSSNPPKVSPEIKEIRTQTLKKAEEFLFSENSVEKSRIGAQVMEKLLRRDGLDDEEEQKYLDRLLSRYKRLSDNPEGALRAELLGAMAGLCTQTSACRDQAIVRYKPLFVESLRDSSDSVRETAVDGLANIDKADALTILREGFVNDPSPAVRKKIIALAGAVLVEKDLKWLVEKIGVNSESEPAWQAMIGIFNRSSADVLNGWVDRLTAEAGAIKLSNDQKIAFLKIAESKAASEKKSEMLDHVRQRLTVLYSRNSQFDKAEENLKKLLATATTQAAKDGIAIQLLGVYMSWPRSDLAANLVAEALQTNDLDREGALLKSLDEHLVKPANGLDPNAAVAQLAAIKVPKDRPKWSQWLQEWQSRLSKEDKPAEKPKPPTG